ncbi:archaetidylinositol phosphate synthase [Methanohalobium sp.]|uniref:archaetidylinositol phosphate synthase n=1 Tax=Methanohalobium sp. TaxID=2837493 RepID=UPI0025EE9F0D|nr:archaetidylinositol phosphate synthase [Methanohalobium sp.]
MTSDSLRPLVSKIIEPFAEKAVDIGLSPNIVSFLSLIFAITAGVFFYYSYTNPLFVLIAGLLVALNSFLDAMDGIMARHMQTASLKGDFLDHVIDRYSDIFVICSIFLAGHVQWQIGLAAIVGVLLTSYLGTQAQALDIGRYYGGIMGRADRLILIIAASLIYFLYPSLIYGFSVLGWTIVIIAVGSHVTAIQRIYHIWKQF